MKDFFSNKSIKILTITLAVAVIFSILGATGNPVINSAVGFITNGLSQVTSAAAEATKQKSYDELLKEIEELINSKKNLECFGIGYVDDLTAQYYPA